MGMRFSYVTVAVAALLTAACPYDRLLTSNGGLAIGGGGGGGTGPDALAFTVQPSSATAGNIITPAIQVLVRDSLGIPDSAFAGSITMSISVNPVGGRLSGTLSVAPVNGIALFVPGDLEGPVTAAATHAGGVAFELRAVATVGADGVARSPGRGEAGGVLRARDDGPAQRRLR